MKPIFKLGLALCVAVPAAAADAATTGMKFISSPGDFVGGGTTQTYTTPTATVAAHGDRNQVHMTVTEGAHTWNLDFAAPQGQALAKGGYAGAARYPFQSPLGAGMSVSGDGRGCNTLRGWFKVLEFEIDASNAIQRLAIDFEQNCEVTMPPLFGSVRINSTRPLAVPSLEAVAGVDFAVHAGQTVTLDGSQSFSRRAPRSLTYRWTQTGGPTVTLANPTAVNPTFTAPPVPQAGDSLRFHLLVDDRSRQSSTDNVVVLVQNETAPRTELSFTGDPGDYISAGRSWHYDGRDAVFNVSRNFDNGVSLSVTSDTWWYLDMAAPNNVPLTVGTYSGAQRFPFQPPTAPGLNLSGDGRGCNTLTGEFTVHQAQYDSGGIPQVLEIDFTQHCEGSVPAAYGRFLLNATPNAQIGPRLVEARRRLGPRE